MAGYILILLVLVGALFLVKMVGRANALAEDGNLEEVYVKKSFLLTDEEKNIYKNLQTIASRYNYVVFPKVKLTSVVYIPKGTSNWISLWNRISPRQVDFVICEVESLKPVVAVEISGGEEPDGAKIEKDEFVPRVLEKAGLSYLLMAPGDILNSDELTAILKPVIESDEAEKV